MKSCKVNAVISDRKIWNATPTSAFKACVVSRTDYTASPSIGCLIKECGIMPTLISLKKENIINRRYYFPCACPPFWRRMLNNTWFSGTESLSGVDPEWSFSGAVKEIGG
jgi:hypothetical protein